MRYPRNQRSGGEHSGRDLSEYTDQPRTHPQPQGSHSPGAQPPSGSPRTHCEPTRATRERWTVRASAGLRRGAHTKGQAGPRGADSARPPRTPGGAHAPPPPHPAPRGSPAAGSRRRPACSGRCTCPWLLLAPRGAASSRWRPGAVGPATRAGSPEPRPAGRTPSAWCARSARAPPRLLCLRPAVGTPPARGAGQRAAAPAGTERGAVQHCPAGAAARALGSRRFPAHHVARPPPRREAREGRKSEGAGEGRGVERSGRVRVLRAGSSGSRPDCCSLAVSPWADHITSLDHPRPGASGAK
jgi:hypothetical protein